MTESEVLAGAYQALIDGLRWNSKIDKLTLTEKEVARLKRDNKRFKTLLKEIWRIQNDGNSNAG